MGRPSDGDAFLGDAEEAGMPLEEARDLGAERRGLQRERIARVNADGRPRVPRGGGRRIRGGCRPRDERRTSRATADADARVSDMRVGL